MAQDIIFGESQPFGEAIKPMHTLTWDTTTSLFPENTNLGNQPDHLFSAHICIEFVAGEPTEILLGFVNTGETVVTVESIQAFLVHPMEFSYHIQNVSVQYFKPYTVKNVSYQYFKPYTVIST